MIINVDPSTGHTASGPANENGGLPPPPSMSGRVQAHISGASGRWSASQTFTPVLVATTATAAASASTPTPSSQRNHHTTLIVAIVLGVVLGSAVLVWVGFRLHDYIDGTHAAIVAEDCEACAERERKERRRSLLSRIDSFEEYPWGAISPVRPTARLAESSEDINGAGETPFSFYRTSPMNSCPEITPYPIRHRVLPLAAELKRAGEPGTATFPHVSTPRAACTNPQRRYSTTALTAGYATGTYRPSSPVSDLKQSLLIGSHLGPPLPFSPTLTSPSHVSLPPNMGPWSPYSSPIDTQSCFSFSSVGTEAPSPRQSFHGHHLPPITMFAPAIEVPECNCPPPYSPECSPPLSPISYCVAPPNTPEDRWGSTVSMSRPMSSSVWTALYPPPPE